MFIAPIAIFPLGNIWGKIRSKWVVFSRTVKFYFVTDSICRMYVIMKIGRQDGQTKELSL